MQIIKSILSLLIIFVLGALGYVIFTSLDRPIRTIPYPYSISSENSQKSDLEAAKASKANVLIVGDRMAVSLKDQLPNLKENIDNALDRKLEVYNWAENHESLARTIHKLKKLKKFPSIVVYFGGTEEFYEQKFNIKSYAPIRMNFNSFSDDRLLSLIITFPWLSKVIYKNDFPLTLKSTPKESEWEPREGERIKQKELTYLIFQQEMKELIELIKSNNSTLITVTPPINLEASPNENCSESNTNTIIELNQEIHELIKQNEFKTAYNQLKDVASVVVGNAETSYLFGLSALKIGESLEARKYLMLANSFDCKPDRADPVFNEIMRKESKNAAGHLIDFDLIGQSYLESNEFFLNKHFPHQVFYNTLNNEIINTLKKILNFK